MTSEEWEQPRPYEGLTPAKELRLYELRREERELRREERERGANAKLDVLIHRELRRLKGYPSPQRRRLDGGVRRPARP